LSPRRPARLVRRVHRACQDCRGATERTVCPARPVTTAPTGRMVGMGSRVRPVPPDRKVHRVCPVQPVPCLARPDHAVRSLVLRDLPDHPDPQE